MMIFALSAMVLIMLSDLHPVQSRTAADSRRTRVADIRLLKGAFMGRIDFVQDALAHADSNVNAIMTSEIGENFLKLGKAGIDFPIAPALHIAISGGTRRHLQVALLLLMRGADPNLFKATTPNFFFPAIYFALGAFGTPSNSQAALLQKLLQAFPQKFNHSATSGFVRRTGSPPPLHTTVMNNFFDGTYLLTSTTKFNINDKDVQGLTALHVAAWLGNSNVLLHLLHGGATPDELDPYNRTFVHYLACRGLFSVLETVLYGNVSPLSNETKLKLLMQRDIGGNSPMDIALMPPAQMRVAKMIKVWLNTTNVTVPWTDYVYSEDMETYLLDTSSIVKTTSKNENYDNDKWQILNCTQYVSQGDVIYPKLKIWNVVPTRNWSRLSENDFKAKFFYPQRPLKLVGNYTSDMKIWKYLDKCEFLSRYGQMSLDTTTANFSYAEGGSDTIENVFKKSKMHDDRHTVLDTCPLSSEQKLATCDGVRNSFFRTGTYMLRNDSVLSQDVIIPRKFFNICSLSKIVANTTYLRVMSSSLHLSPLQRESAFWNVLLVGAVRHWYLMSPGVALNISSDLNIQEDSVENWLKIKYPELRRKRLAVEVIQRTGDVLFLPYGWSYLILSEGDIIDLSHNFCVLPNNTSVFGQIPVGLRMYGHVSKKN